ncbi:hypothetical protein [Acinetobacter sp.]|uniref:hypothetical protein n=1 Tax=Acinetobacter sp. TaxID=472 RepID=UPI002649843E|nr:hypothetical protein [Acinetobacter sp.]MDN5511772.1 hypothetical protein [Acinetobacter sp.]MDN5524888.1 hypothetical protein [Acinetobacter sp.]
MAEILEIAKDFAEDLAPHVTSQTGTVKTLTAEQVSALYHIVVDFWMRNDEPNVNVKLPFTILQSLGEVS